MRLLIRATVIAAILFILSYGCYRAFETRIGISESASTCPLRRLPSGAQEISYLIPGAFGPNEFYEFTIDEGGFRAWVAKRKEEDPDVGPVIERSFSIRRYNIEHQETELIKVNDGLISVWGEEDRGMYFGYDKQNRRAYYHFHSR